jgi:hypothetical protein
LSHIPELTFGMYHLPVLKITLVYWVVDECPDCYCQYSDILSFPKLLSFLDLHLRLAIVVTMFWSVDSQTGHGVR